MARNTLPRINGKDKQVLVNGEVSDLRASRPGKGLVDERDLASEFAGKFSQKKIIDQFEESRGTKRPEKKDFFRMYEWKNIVLEPEKVKDQELLSQLMNDPKFRILVYKDTFSVKGDYRVFVIYGKLKEGPDIGTQTTTPTSPSPNQQAPANQLVTA
jgi:hypothetical protein